MRFLTLSIGLSCILGLAFPSAAADDGAAPAAASAEARLLRCVVTLAEQADLPPHETGMIVEIAREGQQVAADEVVLRLDERKPQKDMDVAAAKRKAAEKKASDRINIEYAEAANAVARQELKVNEEANQIMPGSVTLVRMEELRLKCTETTLAIKKAKLEQEIANEELHVAEAEVEAARLLIERHKIRSPIDGVVVGLRAHKGENVLPSQPVIQIAGLKKLWVEGYAPAAQFARGELEDRPVTVDVVAGQGRKVSLPGKVVFVKPSTDTGGNYMVRAEVENSKAGGSWLLGPGMPAEMTIRLK
jgi:multidrug efflux pump subunit AcrA (membrane-fusion protein)